MHERLLTSLLPGGGLGREALVQSAPPAVRAALVATTRRAVAYNQTRAASPSGTSASRRHAVRNVSEAASCASADEPARQRQ